MLFYESIPLLVNIRLLMMMQYDAIGAKYSNSSLKDFQRLAGWINWALNVFPLLRPGLSGIYDKMRRGLYPFLKLCINNTICSELHWLADHISASNGVHIIKSQEWPRLEAHDTFLCDACPTGMC